MKNELYVDATEENKVYVGDADTSSSALVTFFLGHGDEAVEVMRIAKDGFYWKGERVDDVHNVYERFNEWLTSAELLKGQKDERL